ncbi:MAG: DUF2085 domain-containing protein [Candidatus Poseidonia sp.]|nr:DUF2085 domain-containing protein [Poseidonia sp.]
MERNGLPNRRREKKIGLWFMGVSGFFLLSFFLAPYTLEAGSVVEIEGRANAFDFATLDGWGSNGNQAALPHVHHEGDEDHRHGTYSWTSMNPYAGFIYAFGDLNCHQKHERSWEVNGNQMPVCTRDVGIFAGLFIGGWLFSRRGWNRWTVRDTNLSLLPKSWLEPIYAKNKRTIAWFGIGVLICLPLIFDGFLQLLTSYESTNAKRVLTGLPFGFGIALLMSSMIAAQATEFNHAGQVVLPGNSRFSLAQEEE